MKSITNEELYIWATTEPIAEKGRIADELLERRRQENWRCVGILRELDAIYHTGNMAEEQVSAHLHRIIHARLEVEFALPGRR